LYVRAAESILPQLARDRSGSGCVVQRLSRRAFRDARECQMAIRAAVVRDE
jgi:hypothetical protein